MISSQPTRKEDDDHQYFKDAGSLAFRSEQVHQESSDTIRLKCPDKPENKENNGHGRSHVEIGVGAAEQGAINVKGAGRRIDMSPAHRPDSRNQSRPVGEENEDENGGEEPERFLHQLPSDDPLEKIIETFHQPFPKVLRTGRDGFDISGRDLREEDHRQRDNPRGKHRIRNRKFPDLKKRRGLERKSFVLGRFGRQRRYRRDQSSNRAKSNQPGSKKIAVRKH